jgi:hypothetical protein
LKDFEVSMVSMRSMSALRTAVFALLVIAAHANAASPATPGKAQPVVTDGKAQVVYLSDLGQRLNDCRAIYLSERDYMAAKLQSALAFARGDSLRDGKGGQLTAIELEQLRQKVLSDSDSGKLKFPGCRSDANAAMASGAKGLLDGFSDAPSKAKAKETLAQWMTTLEAVNTEGFAQEYGKYTSLANLLKLELTLK